MYSGRIEILLYSLVDETYEYTVDFKSVHRPKSSRHLKTMLCRPAETQSLGLFDKLVKNNFTV